MHRASCLSFCSLAALLALGCDAEPADHFSSSRSSLLRSLGSCTEVLARTQDKAIRDMRERVEQVRKEALASGCYEEYEEYACGDAGGGGGGSGRSASTGSGEAGATETSGTNNQVAGVDEPDLVKNDSQYLYQVGNRALRIIDAWPAADAHEVARLPIEGTPTQLFVAGDRALVYSSLPAGPPEAGGQGGWSSQPCTYGYDCAFIGDGWPTKLTVVDLADRRHPRVVRQLWSNGSQLGARRIGDATYSVLSAPEPSVPGLVFVPPTVGCSGKALSAEEINRAFDELIRENTALIRAFPVGDFLPSVRMLDGAGSLDQAGPNLLASCDGFYVADVVDGAAFTTLIALDLAEAAEPQLTTIIGRPGVVYASGEALYVAANAVAWSDAEPQSGEATPQAAVHKFGLEPSTASARYVASGLVKGRLLNQFSMDEHRGHLRIATTTGHVPDPNVHSTLSVLGEGRDGLEVVGLVDQIAPTEDIRSVRFDGDRGFIVTFKKTDPLFVFDLSEPSRPVAVGELKIPGFSTYMHLMDDKHLLSIGYDAEDHGDFAYFTGLLLQIFDVSDPKKPALRRNLWAQLGPHVPEPGRAIR